MRQDLLTRLAGVAALSLVFLALTASLAAARGLRIVVTFPSLVPDVKSVTCSDDTVVSLVPPGVDPHHYQLKPSDVKLLNTADLIISTGHTPFEKRIEDLVKQGVIRARLIIVWRAPGVKIFRNPVTGQPDLHMPIYDPRNYLAFMRFLVDQLSSMRPECSRVYHANLERIAERLHELMARAPRLNVDAVADAPFTVYAVSWLGIRVVDLLVPEPGMPASPQLYSLAERVLARGGYAVVTEPARAKASETLLELAEEHGAPVVRVLSPLVGKSVLEKLEYIVEQVEHLAERRAGRTFLAEVFSSPVARWLTIIISSSIAFGVLSALVAARRLYFLAAGLPHASLVAALLAIPITYYIGGVEAIWAAVISVVVILVFAYLVERGVDPDIAASVYVAAAASASVALMYYILERFTVTVDLWAYILGDPLLVTPLDAILTLIVGVVVLVIGVLVYREEVCIGIESETVRLAGIRVRVYDTMLVSILAAASVLLLRSVGFVVEHVMLLLPGAIAVTIARGMWRAMLVAIGSAILAGLGGLALSLSTGLAPAAMIGALLVTFYGVALLASR